MRTRNLTLASAEAHQKNWLSAAVHDVSLAAISRERRPGTPSPPATCETVNSKTTAANSSMINPFVPFS
jgi:hypothetical protein